MAIDFNIDPFSWQRGADQAARQNIQAQEAADRTWDADLNRQNREYERERQRELDQYEVPLKKLNFELQKTDAQDKMDSRLLDKRIRDYVDGGLAVDADGKPLKFDVSNAGVDNLAALAKRLYDTGDVVGSKRLTETRLAPLTMQVANQTADPVAKANVLMRGGLLDPSTTVTRVDDKSVSFNGNVVPELVLDQYLKSSVDKLKAGLPSVQMDVAGKVAQQDYNLYRWNVDRAKAADDRLVNADQRQIDAAGRQADVAKRQADLDSALAPHREAIAQASEVIYSDAPEADKEAARKQLEIAGKSIAAINGKGWGGPSVKAAPANPFGLPAPSPAGAGARTNASSYLPERKSVLDADTQLRVKVYSKTFGGDPIFLERVAGPESGGRADAKNPDSTAYGRWQLLEGTAKSLGYTPEQMKDPNIQAQAAAKLSGANNNAYERAFNLAPSLGDQYGMWFFGQGSIPSMKAPQNMPIDKWLGTFESPARVKEILRTNPQLAGKTWGEVRADLGAKVGEAAPRGALAAAR